MPRSRFTSMLCLQCHLPGLQEDSRAELLFPFRREDLPVSFSVRMPDSGGYAHFLYVPWHADFWDFLAHELTTGRRLSIKPRLGVAKMWWQWRQIKLSFFQLTLARTKKLGMAGVKGNHNGDGRGENICVTKMIESCSVVTPVQIKNMARLHN